MIASISTADYNIEETLSTLRYADGASKLKTKPVVNQDAKVADINEPKKNHSATQTSIVTQYISYLEDRN